MQWLRPAGDARPDALEWLQYIQKTRRIELPRPSARDFNTRLSSLDAISSLNNADSSCSSFDRTFHGCLQLPAELRLEIYRLAFIGDRNHHEGYQIGRPVGRMPPKSRLRNGKSIRPFSEDVRENQRGLEGTPILALAFTCRQVYFEAAPIYYGGIIWHFHSTYWLKLFVETMGPKNKIRGIGSRILEAVRHIRIKLHSPRMMALAGTFPHLTRLDIFKEAVPQQEQVLLKILKKTCPTPCPQKMPFLKTLNYGSLYNKNFPQVIWSEDADLRRSTMTKHFHTSRQLRLFANTIGQEARDSIRIINVQLEDAAMAEELLRFKNIVIIRLLNDDAGALSISTLHTLCDKFKSLRAGLRSLANIEIQDPRDASEFVRLEEHVNAIMDGTFWEQPKICDSSSEESSREATPAAWASS